MSDKKREPILSDKRIASDCPYGQSSTNADVDWMDGAKHVRDIYEEARTKDAELIQRLVDALYGEARGRSQAVSTASIALADAEAAGFKPTDA